MDSVRRSERSGVRMAGIRRGGVVRNFWRAEEWYVWGLKLPEEEMVVYLLERVRGIRSGGGRRRRIVTVLGGVMVGLVRKSSFLEDLVGVRW